MSVLLVAMAAVAANQSESESSIAETRELIASYGTCVVERQPVRASEAIVRNVDNGTLLSKYARLIDGDCLPRRPEGALQLRFTGDQYRYALADALVQRDLSAVPAPNLDGVAALDHREPADPPSQVTEKGKPVSAKKYQRQLKSYEEAQAFNFLSRYGECVVRVNPAAARALLMTAPESTEETARFADMRVALGTCMPEGHTVAFGKLVLRGTIAINYYRLAKAAAAVRAAGGAAK